MSGRKKVSQFDPLQVWDRVEKDLQKMSSRQRAQTLVKAGIVTPKMNLRKPYREAFKAASA